MPQRRIWLCADDYGMAPGVNAAIRELIAKGRINATSVMVVAPSLDRMAADALTQAAAANNACIGLHLTLTAPFRPLAQGFRPLHAGTFLNLQQTLRAALQRRFDAGGLQAEVAAQLAAFKSMFGRGPDFIDGHQHVHLFPQVRDAVLVLAVTEAPGAWLRQCGSVQPLAARLGDPKGLLVDFLSRAFRHRASALGIATNAAFAGTYAFRPEVDFAALFPRFLRALPDGGLVMCHPGHVDAELIRLDPVTHLREREYAYLDSTDAAQVLANAGFALA
jgi:predicted glycoside hydrolase/deacetylase ChbG (UPF0249 family)